MNLKQFAGKMRDAVKGPEDESSAPETAGTVRPFSWDAPEGGIAAVHTPAPAPQVVRPEPKPPVAKEAAPREAPRADVRRPDIGRAADVRLGGETPEGTGRAGRWKASATVPDLVTVYKEAGIESPLHGYGVDKLTEMLGSPHLASASRDVRATAAQVALEAARVPLRDIIDDALLRSKALAAFEADKAFDLQASQMRAERRAQVLRDQVDVFRKQKQAEMEELKRTIDSADNSLAQLRARKRREQERLHRVVTHFVEPRPAVATPTIAPRPAAAAPSPAPSASTPAPSPSTSAPAPSAPVSAAGASTLPPSPTPLAPLAPPAPRAPSASAPAPAAQASAPTGAASTPSTSAAAPPAGPATQTPEPAVSGSVKGRV